MIFDFIQNKNNYKDFPMLYQALCFLSELKTDRLPTSKTSLIPEKLFCIPVSLTSRPEEECIYEAHRRYFDLHYIVSGTERIATADVTSLTVKTPYIDTDDIEFLTGSANGYYDLKPGSFMVFFPHDAHKVGMMVKHPSDIKKIVFKIRTEE